MIYLCYIVSLSKSYHLCQLFKDMWKRYEHMHGRCLWYNGPESVLINL